MPTEWVAELMLLSSGSALAASNSVHDRLALPKRFYTLIWPALQAVAMMAGYSLYVALE